jgi:hypothetical protein
MENETRSQNPDYPYNSSETEKEKMDAFISVMTQIVEKYGRIVLQKLDHVA